MAEEQKQQETVETQEPTVEVQSEKKEKKKNKRDSELESLKNELESKSDLLIRTAAEFDNYKKRTEREKSGIAEYAKAGIIKKGPL